MGLGYALTEELIVEEGRVLNPDLLDYRLFTSADMPKIETFIIETNDPRGPFGAKGVGEMGGTPTAAAIANAIYDAVGVRIKDENGFREVRAKVVVDATGQNGLLMNKLNLRVWDPILNKGAIWTYWEGATRDDGRDAGATLIIQNGNKSGWFW